MHVPAIKLLVIDLAAGTEDLDICGKETTDFRRNYIKKYISVKALGNEDI